MILTRVSTGIVISILGWVILFSLWVIWYDHDWNRLGEWYQAARQEMVVEIPLILRLLRPFAPIEWWGWLSPVAFGVCAGLSVRKARGWLSQLGSVLGALLVAAVVWSSLVSCTRMTFHMGKPYEPVVENERLLGNVSLLLIGVISAGYSAYRKSVVDKFASNTEALGAR